ncbi:hypothetical protein CIHG_01231 [Coccidioides immitis H538.4]|uniref:Uncharacterized protein n=3 Tax=Coccidioides immitis TaxID=5501 RepID=A0A0J8TGQ0_COCIT|nr:hypothetical protein CIRG_01080 [Coccidioides immitis RMSCC 2394]KMU72827.1 hypothetical protein CISG_03261 [Coccidioides immitis RMSCC 3703]KMU83449.1 hypothetical protein CIHG_01231 [Coccidioides immitis H538.4]
MASMRLAFCGTEVPGIRGTVICPLLLVDESFWLGEKVRPWVLAGLNLLEFDHCTYSRLAKSV